MRYAGCLIGVCVACCVCVPSAAQQAQEGQKAGEWEGQTVESWPSDARGNWYIKRQYVKEAEKLYRAVREAQKEVEKVQDTFTKQRDAISQTIWDFYSEYYIETERLMDRVNTILQMIEQEDGQLSQEERDWREKARGFKASLEDIKDHITSLQKLKDGADQSVSLFEKQLDVIDSYEQKAWETYQEIAQTVSDRVAEEQYRQMQGMRNNADQVVTYVKNNLVSFVKDLKSQVDTYVKRLRETIQKIEEGGVTLREKLQEAQQEEEQAEEDEQKQKEQPEQEHKQEEPVASWWTQAWNWTVDTITAAGAWVASAWNTLLGYIGLGGQEQ